MLRRLFAVSVLAVLLGAVPTCEKEKPEAPPPPEVVVAPVEKKDVEIYTEWVGTTTGYVNAQIYPKIQGYLLKQDYTDGGTVQAGDLLFEIDPRQFQAALDQATGQLGRAQAALGKSELDVQRYTPLAAQGAVSQQELDDAIQGRAANAAEVESAKATVEQARLNLEWTQVKAPISGIAAIATAQVGDLVSPTTRLTSISLLDPMKVTFPISEIEYLRWEPERREEERLAKKHALELILANGNTYPYPGHFNVAGLAVNESTGTINVQGLFPNSNNLLRPGQYVRVRAVTSMIPDALVIQQRAVRDMQGVNQVAVIGPDDKATFKSITLGPATGSSYVVSAGLQAGDRIVVEGLQKIRDGAAVKPVAAPAPKAAAAAPATGAGK